MLTRVKRNGRRVAMFLRVYLKYPHMTQTRQVLDDYGVACPDRFLIDVMPRVGVDTPTPCLTFHFKRCIEGWETDGPQFSHFWPCSNLEWAAIRVSNIVERELLDLGLWKVTL